MEYLIGTDEVWDPKWRAIRMPQGDSERLLDYLRRSPWIAGWLVPNITTGDLELCILNPHWDWRWNEGWKCRGGTLDVVPLDIAWLE